MIVRSGITFGVLGIGVMGAFFTFRTVVVAHEDRGTSAALALMVLLVALVLILGGAIVLPARPSLRLFRSLRSRYPDSTMFRVLLPKDARIAVARLLSLPLAVPLSKYLVVIVRGDAVEYWSTGATTPLVAIRTDEIHRVQVKAMADSTGFTHTNVVMDVKGGDGPTLSLPMLVLRNSGTGAFPASRDAADELAAAIKVCQASGG